MVAGSDFVRYLLSVSGVVVAFVVLAIWIARRPASVLARRCLLGCAVVFAAASIYAGQYLVARVIAAGFRPLKPADVAAGRRTAVVVLGGGGYDVEDWSGRTYSVVDFSAATRVLEASRVYKMIDPAFVISSGGNPYLDSSTRPTGETMRGALATLGVPADRIIVETVSRTTRDEAIVVAAILKEQAAEQVVLVTSQTHMRRALGAFRAVGVYPIPAVALEFDRAKTLLQWAMPGEVGLLMASNNAHEILGIVYYWLRGWWKR